jgi:hypothetical protein
MKRIRVDSEGWGDYWWEPNDKALEELGLEYIKRSYGVLYKIIDENLFFLNAIKHGFVFQEVDESYEEKSKYD